MPASLGFMLCEIPKWFSKSAIRREAYKELFETFKGCNIENWTAPLPFQKYNQTRWLVRGKVIYNTPANRQILKKYFSLAEVEGEANVRYKARMLKDMLYDPINLLYFHFLSPVVAEFKRVNAFFQATDIDADAMVKELNLYYNSLQGRVFNSSGVPLPSDKVDYGAKFIHEATELQHRENNGVAQRIRDVYSHCHAMLLVAAEQVQKRLPPNQSIFKGNNNKKYNNKIYNLTLEEKIHRKITGRNLQ
jgi:hypothetical protein